ncbi:MAG: 30S ribosomal protein S9 [Chloroflexi bacterium]|nr:30S ribosomal protein S9 [Chloroflexota bacterium]MDA1217340.1 30S ribosomal protein S9 [Chloroflexota bacterium]RLT45098.1 MAG: 30S ribosomal protein S9 [Chloroflexota bacterium]RLT51518.1 MAG: 30S ribosomal protein S9 [Chloroflexota bacterium]
MTDKHYYEGVGRRKRSTARARLFPGGAGKMTVNDLPGREYFDRLGDYDSAVSPLRATGTEKQFDITIVVLGGGITGQSDASRHAIARALLQVNEELRPQLRKAGLLTRDAREKERKKVGLKRARKAPTYTKR